MYKIEIYEKNNGSSDIWDFLDFVLLHHFRKKTQKTPKAELEQAKRERDDYITRKETAK